MATIKVIGNLGKDPELKYLSGANGDFAIARFSIAETERVKQGNEYVNGETQWWNVSCTGNLAESVIESISKGTKLIVEGDLKYYEYEKNGEKKSGWEIRAKSVGIVPAPIFKKEKKAEETWF